MEHTPYVSRLRYLDADDVDDAVIDYDGLDVYGPDGQKLGDIDGFIVDAQAGRVYYVVIDAGGWFRSRRLLLPVGHATLDSGNRSLRVDVAKDALTRYPEFDADRFREFSDEDLHRFEASTSEACCPGEPLEDVSVRTWAYDTRRHYTQPAWWEQSRVRTAGATSGVAAAAVDLRRDRHDAISHDATDATWRHEDRAHLDQVRERVVATERTGADDTSPHYEGRAQPGDVLGLETGGERTGIGDTAEDENERRRDAERELVGRDRKDDRTTR